MELNGFLAEKMLVKAHEKQKKMIVAWGSQCRATHMRYHMLRNNTNCGTGDGTKRPIR